MQIICDNRFPKSFRLCHLNSWSIRDMPFIMTLFSLFLFLNIERIKYFIPYTLHVLAYSAPLSFYKFYMYFLSFFMIFFRLILLYIKCSHNIVYKLEKIQLHSILKYISSYDNQYKLTIHCL